MVQTVLYLAQKRK